MFFMESSHDSWVNRKNPPLRELLLSPSSVLSSTCWLALVVLLTKHAVRFLSSSRKRLFLTHGSFNFLVHFFGKFHVARGSKSSEGRQFLFIFHFADKSFKTPYNCGLQTWTVPIPLVSLHPYFLSAVQQVFVEPASATVAKLWVDFGILDNLAHPTMHGEMSGSMWLSQSLRTTVWMNSNQWISHVSSWWHSHQVNQISWP